MALDKIEVYTIKLIGRWKSDAFLCYIRKQVKEFTFDVSTQMIRNKHFSHIPQRSSVLIKNKDGRTSKETPRIEDLMKELSKL